MTRPTRSSACSPGFPATPTIIPTTMKSTPPPAPSLLTDYYPPTPFTKSAVALIFPQWGEGGNAWTAPTDKVASVSFVKDEMDVLLGLQAQLHPEVLPWNLTDKNVVYSSADERIATVDENGVVTASAWASPPSRRLGTGSPGVCHLRDPRGYAPHHSERHFPGQRQCGYAQVLYLEHGDGRQLCGGRYPEESAHGP